jgi:hypothetical protein
MAITSLTASIPRATAALGAHQQSLISLREILNNLSLPELRQDLSAGGEPVTSRMYEDLATDVKSNLTRATTIVEAQISEFEQESQKLLYHQNRLEDELIGWNFTRDLAQRAISHLTEIRTKFGSDLSAAKATISPIRRIPKEVWIKLFRYCINGEYNAYITNSTISPYRSVPLSLSGVCRSWRNVIFSESKLWNLVTVHPSAHISLNKHNMLHDHFQRIKSSFVIVSNLSQTLSWTWSYHHRGHYYSNPNNNLTANNVSIPTGYTYAVHVVMNDDSYNTIQKAVNLPYSDTKNLRMNIRSNQSSGSLSNIFSHFSNIEQLDLRCFNSHIAQPQAPSFPFQSLLRLNLDVQDASNLDLAPLLGVEFAELRVRHNGGANAVQLSSTVQLPHLKVLGIPYSSLVVLEKLQTPAINTLELYRSSQGSADIEYQSEYRSDTMNNIRHIRQVSMLDWKIRPSNIDNPGTRTNQDAASVFVSLATHIPALRSALFSNCSLDGQQLTDFFKMRLGGHDVIPHFESITFSGCDGITLAQCEELRSIVPRLHIYI